MSADGKRRWGRHDLSFALQIVRIASIAWTIEKRWSQVICRKQYWCSYFKLINQIVLLTDLSRNVAD